jgi:hypothetical protein
MQAWKSGLRKETRGLKRHFRTKNGMPSLPAALKGYDFLIILDISSSEIYMGEGFSAGYKALEMSERSASGIGGKIEPSELLLFQRGSWRFLRG